VYSVANYGVMIADRARMGAFAAALEANVAPGSVVLDLGAGTGIMALLACRFGARRVFAIEPDNAIQVAREIAALNGCADRIDFIQAISSDVTIAEKADVLVHDIGGLMPWFQQHIPAIVDARRRFLAPGGVLIPMRDEVWATVVEAADLYGGKTGPWEHNGFGLDMTPARDVVLNTWTRGRVTREAFLSAPQVLATLEYAAISEVDLNVTVGWTIDRPGIGHGLLAGVNRTVATGICLSNLPDAPAGQQSDGVYETVFFPWAGPVTLDAGDSVTCDIDAKFMRDDYVWTWKTRVRGADGADKTSFAQSTLFGTPLTRDTLKKRAARYVPRMNDDGRIVQVILAAMGRGLSIGEIAAALHSEFPARFLRPQDALSHVVTLSSLYD
jgi:type I protein arginine methyltransferase